MKKMNGIKFLISPKPLKITKKEKQRQKLIGEYLEWLIKHNLL